MDKFDRAYTLEVLPAYEAVEKSDGSREFIFSNSLDTDNNTVTIQLPFTVAFNVRRPLFSTASTGTFQIFNLSPTTRRLLYKDIMNLGQLRTMEFKAGYGGQNYTLFKGNISECMSGRRSGGVDFLTEIYAQDMGFAMANSVSNISETNTSHQNLINKLINNLSYYQVGKGAIGNFSGSSVRYTELGNTWSMLKVLTSDKCFISNAKVYCLNDNEYYGDTYLINSDSGLLCPPRKSQGKLIIEVLFDPRISPGNLINLDSNSPLIQSFNGEYKVVGVEHSGMISASVGGPCKTTLTVLLVDKMFLQGQALTRVYE